MSLLEISFGIAATILPSALRRVGLRLVTKSFRTCDVGLAADRRDHVRRAPLRRLWQNRRVPRSRALVVAAVVAGIVLIAISIVYWIEPARSLPSFFPGHEAGSSHHHVKHGLAAFLLGLACLAYAWFATGAPREPTSS
jgi:hypothetical protein